MVAEAVDGTIVGVKVLEGASVSVGMIGVGDWVACGIAPHPAAEIIKNKNKATITEEDNRI
jgi:hypothetical protein